MAAPRPSEDVEKSGLSGLPGGDDAPELHNSEQEDEDSQAHSVADEALNLDPGHDPLESAKPSTPDIDPDGAQDLVDHLNDMLRSGRIDMGAFENEPQFDDEADPSGDDAVEDDEEGF